MNAEIPYSILNQRKPVSHLAFVVFSVLFVGLTALTGTVGPFPFPVTMFLLLLIQLEFFIFLGSRLFAGLSFDRSPGEITRIILLRFVFFLAACMAASLVLFILFKLANLWIMGGDKTNVIYDFFHFEISGWFKSTISGLSLGAVIFIFLLWQTSLRREQKLKEENLVFQNETLRSQVNPHFLFNSLNTVSALIQSQPDVAEKFINDLSSIYRYILENGQKDKIPLKLELDFITGYFNLHKIRDDGKIILKLDISEAGNYEILPVSLQILIENAILHNMATRENPLTISIYVEGKYIVVKNNLQKKATQLKSTGKGLGNLAERVRLITRRPLVIEETNSHFIVKTPLI
jgi:two-component system, LytTR family, sensor kinase